MCVCACVRAVGLSVGPVLQEHMVRVRVRVCVCACTMQLQDFLQVGEDAPDVGGGQEGLL